MIPTNKISFWRQSSALKSLVAQNRWRAYRLGGSNEGLHQERLLRIFIVAAALGLLALPRPGHSEEKTKTDLGTPRAVRISPADQAVQSSAMAKEAREKAEALERARDRKMREVSKSICNGC